VSLLQAEMMGGYYVLQFLKIVGIFIGGIIILYIIKETAAKLKEDRDKKENL
jgi:hypothetical protein